MFLWRRDKKTVERGKRRIKSDRASVFSEFAFLAPLLMLLLSAMIELVSFWDAKIMANHAAWTVGRIAQVRCVEDQSKGSTKLYGMKFGEKYKVLTNEVTSSSLSVLLKGGLSGTGAADILKTRQDVVSLFMMSTCGMGGYGTYWYDGKGKGDSLKNLFTAQLNTLTDFILEKVKGFDKQIADLAKIPAVGGIFKVIAAFIQKLVTKVVEAILKPIVQFVQRIINWVIDKLFAPFNRDVAEDDAVWERMYSRVSAAKDRMKGDNYKCELTVDKASGSIAFKNTIWTGTPGKENDRLYRFTYPQAAMQSDKRENGWLKKAQGWPVNGQKQSLIKVTLDWPFSSGWIFPIVSGFGKIEGDVVTRGTSLVYHEPAIMDEHLLSVGSHTYDKGAVTEPANDWGPLGIGNYIKMMNFALCYRMAYEEELKAKDMGSKWKAYTHKTIKPLYEILANNDRNNSDYCSTFRDLTGSSDQNMLLSKLKSKLKLKNWCHRNYLHWLSALRHRYYVSDAPCGTEGHAHAIHGGGPWAELFFKDNTPDGRMIDLASMYCNVSRYYRADPSDVSIASAMYYSTFWPDAPQKYKDVVKCNTYTLIRLCFRSKAEADAMVTTNQYLSGCCGKVCLLRKQAENFNTDMYRYKTKFGKLAAGNSEEVISGMQDVLTDEQIRALEDPKEQAKKVQERWEELKKRIETLYKQIDSNIDSFASEGRKYKSTLNGFVNRQAAFYQRMVEAAKRYADEHPDEEASGAALEEKLRAYISGTSLGSDFRKANLDLIKADDDFRTMIAKTHTLENDYASLIGAGTPGGGRKLTPDDIGDGDGPGKIDDAEGSPNSGNDTLPAGEKWELDNGGWKEIK